MRRNRSGYRGPACRNPYEIQVNTKNKDNYHDKEHHRFRVVIPMRFRSIQSLCKAAARFMDTWQYTVVIPMRFRSIQRVLTEQTENGTMTEGRNPYEIQVNTKAKKMASMRFLASPCRNPYEIQVNTKAVN